jgi:glycosyltransferase involved in cell wall biosynthesis
MIITLLSNFKEDERLSMDNYRDLLFNNFVNNKKFIIKKFIPCKSNLFNSIRYSRYIEYPRVIKKIHSNTFHIVEDGYAHLIKSLDPKKTVISIFDLIPLVFWKKNFYLTRPPLFYLYSLSYLKFFKTIIVCSENTKKDLVNLCNIKEEIIKKVFYPVQKEYKIFSKEKKFFYKNKYNFKKDYFYILLTGKDFYKNHLRALRAISSLIKEGFKIKIVKLGSPYKDWLDEIKKLNIESSIIYFSKYLSNHEICEIYNICDLLFFPSLYEGFGLPVVESMACGLPVLSSQEGSLKEIAGGCSFLTNPYDIYDMTKKLTKLIKYKDLRYKLIAMGLKNSKRFSEKSFYDGHENIYSSLNNFNF